MAGGHKSIGKTMNRFAVGADIVFWLMVGQGLSLVAFIFLFAYDSPLLAGLIAANPLATVFVSIISFVFFIAGLAFVILPADLIYERTSDEKEKFFALLPMLLVPWLNFVFDFFFTPGFAFFPSLGKTAVIWFIGGLLAYCVGLFALEKLKLQVKEIPAIALVAVAFVLLAGYAYQNLFAYNWLSGSAQLLFWHTSLFIYAFSVFRSLKQRTGS